MTATPTTEASYVDAANIDAVSKVSGRIVAAWARNDGEAFADVFTPDGTMILPGNVFAQGREQIAAYMTKAFAGPYKGTQVTGSPVSVRFLGPDVAVLTSRGGVLEADETELAPASKILATWLLTRRDGQWQLAAYQNTPTAP